MKRIIRTFAPLGLACLATGTGTAATIMAAGSVSGIQVNEWRSPGTTKAADLEGDNVYGTFGSAQWTVAGINEHPGGSTSPGWSYEESGSQFSISGGASLDANYGGPDVQSSIALNSFTFELTGVPATYAGMIVRFGVMQDMLGSGEWAADQNKGLRLVQTVGGSGDSGMVSVRGGGAADGVPEMYFFDITGVNSGDRFQIQGLNNVSGAGATQLGYIGPVSWDLVAVPEPGSAMLGAIGFMLLSSCRSRARRAA